MSEKSVPVVYSISNDLFFGMRIKNSAEQLDIKLRWIDKEEKFNEALEEIAQEAINSKSVFLLDLGAKMNWPAMLKQAKEDKRIGEIPWIAYGSHVEKDILAQARRLGADQVLARSKFTKMLPEILHKIK